MSNFEKKKIKLLTIERQKSDENAKMCYICRETFNSKINMLKISKIAKLATIVIMQVSIEVLHIAYII